MNKELRTLIALVCRSGPIAIFDCYSSLQGWTGGDPAKDVDSWKDIDFSDLKPESPPPASLIAALADIPPKATIEEQATFHALIHFSVSRSAQVPSSRSARVWSAILRGCGARAALWACAPIYWATKAGLESAVRTVLLGQRLSKQNIKKLMDCRDPEAIASILGMTAGWEHVLGDSLDGDDDGPDGELRSIRIDRALANALVVRCPSTGRKHILLVPKACESARAARLWTFNEIEPHIET